MLLQVLTTVSGTTQKCSALQNLRQLYGGQADSRRGVDCDWAAISRLSLWTVPVPSPVMRATFPMPRPLASSWRARAICLGSAPGRPRRLRTMPALVVKYPSGRGANAFTRRAIATRTK